MTLPVERTTTAVPAPDGTRLAVHRVDGPGEPLLVLPGGPGRASTYLEDLGGLAAEHALALVDTRGSGRSEVPADPETLRAPALAEDVEVVRRALAVDPVVVLGHSAGCLTALLWAAAHPQRVRGLVLACPPRLPHLDLPEDDRPAVRAARAGEPWYPEAAAASEELARGDVPPASLRLLTRAVRPFGYGAWTERQQAHAAAADHEVSRRPSEAFGQGLETGLAVRLHGLAALDVPVLVVGGSRDGMTGVAPVAALAATLDRPGRRSPVGTAVVEGAGHFPWVDEPAAWREAVSGFLRGVA